jgi:hypothetical protein
MNRVRVVAMAVVVLVTAPSWGQSAAQKTLDTFKTMAGTWVGKTAKGEPVEITYQLMAGGTSVMADQHMGDEPMTSMFYVNGDRLLMTHFCPSNNQPRMQATISPDGKTASFDFLDATNLASPQAGHMHKAVYVFVDADHYSEEWTWKQGEKNTRMHFDLQRKK